MVDMALKKGTDEQKLRATGFAKVLIANHEALDTQVESGYDLAKQLQAKQESFRTAFDSVVHLTNLDKEENLEDVPERSARGGRGGGGEDDDGEDGDYYDEGSYGSDYDDYYNAVGEDGEYGDEEAMAGQYKGMAWC